MVGLGDVECPVGSHEYQRTLGWVFKEEPPYPSVPLFRCVSAAREGKQRGRARFLHGLELAALTLFSARCFNKATRRHSVSTTTTCESGSLEFRLGFLLAA